MLPKKCEKPTIKSCAWVPLSLYSKYKICKRKGREYDIFTDPSKKKLSQGQSGKREGCGDSFLTVVKVELWTIISKKLPNQVCRPPSYNFKPMHRLSVLQHEFGFEPPPPLP